MIRSIWATIVVVGSFVMMGFSCTLTFPTGPTGCDCAFTTVDVTVTQGSAITVVSISIGGVITDKNFLKTEHAKICGVCRVSPKKKAGVQPTTHAANWGGVRTCADLEAVCCS